MNRHKIANSHTAWSVDAANSEAAHALANEAQGGRCSSGLFGRSVAYPRARDESRPGFPAPTPAEACETAESESPSGSPDSRGESSHPDSSGTLEPGHPFAAVIGDLSTILVNRFLSTCDSKPRKRALLSWPQRARKKPRMAWSDPFMDVELASDSEDLDTIVVHHSGARVSTFACPFYLMDKEKHEACLTRHNLSTIDELKEHIWTSHRRPNFCPICKDTFATMKARDDHIRDRNCQHRDLPTFDGLTDGQIQQISRQGSPPSSKESQWYGIWDVVSPLGPRPLSPYYSSEQEFRAVALRRFWDDNGRTIISDLLREKGLQGWEVEDEERSLDILFKIVLHDAIDEVHGSFAEGTCELDAEH